jgi:hypothetical protein
MPIIYFKTKDLMSYINLLSKFVLIFLIFVSYIFQYNLFYPQENFYIKIIEFYDKTDSVKVDLIRVIDGDTVEVNLWNEKIKVRIVGYDAYELSEPKGLEAKSYLESLCVNAEVYLDIDDLEPKDKYNRTLGYLYCKKGNEEIYRSVTKSFLILRPDLVKKPLQIPPDEHPYTVWLTKHFIKIVSDVKFDLYVYNLTGNYKLNGTSVTLTGGYYVIESNLFINIKELNLLTDKSKTITLEAKYKETTVTITETSTVSETVIKTNTVYETTTEKFNYTITNTVTVTNTYISPSETSNVLYIIIIISLLALVMVIYLFRKLKRF